MAQNPLLGNRISLITKRNIRYEGTLYSIDEKDHTVALQNVRSFGTEGRESLDADGRSYVPPQDTVHMYLKFRGCDIKDLHVHETTSENENSEPPQDDAIVSAEAPPTREEGKESDKQISTNGHASKSEAYGDKPKAEKPKQTRKQKSNAQVGTGASLLNRKERGAVEGGIETPSDDFDFQSNLESFDKPDGDDGQNEDPAGATSAYAKDDFFDSISCDALDKQAGVDNRLRGKAERNQNMETFGATALNSHRRGGRRGRNSGRGRGGRGRGRGRGSGRGKGPRPKENNRWKRDQSKGDRQSQNGSANSLQAVTETAS